MDMKAAYYESSWLLPSEILRSCFLNKKCSKKLSILLIIAKITLSSPEKQRREKRFPYQAPILQKWKNWSDWSLDQVEARLALETEREFMTSKLDNKTNPLHAVRSEIEHVYEQLHVLETEIGDLDQQIETVNK